MLKSILDQVLPPRCPLSGQIVATQGSLSPKAWEGLNFIADPFCNSCGLPLEIAMKDMGELLCGSCVAIPKQYHQARSAVVYDDTSRNLILAFKHGDQTHLSLTFVPWLKTAGSKILKDCDMLVPVPLHWRRLLMRRYNQSGLFAQRLAKETGLSYTPDVLKRIRHTPVQGHLSAKERYKNVKHAFVLSPKYREKMQGCKVVLIDDVYTTGATVEECAEILYAAGASIVDVLTVARVSRADNIS